MKINKSASRTVDILDLVSRAEQPLTISEISKMLDIPKTSTFEILYTLIEKGYLEIADERLKTFRLGIRIFQTGIRYLTKTDLHREARPLLEKLMNETGDTVFLVVEDKGQLIYLDKAEGTSAVRTTANLGTRSPMHCSGVGKALLAAYPEEKVKEIFRKSDMTKRTPYTITNYADLILDLERTRQRGYAIDNREGEIEVFCVAAPIYNQFSQPIAAISIASLYSKINDERLHKFERLITETALGISKRLGFTGERLF